MIGTVVLAGLGGAAGAIGGIVAQEEWYIPIEPTHAAMAGAATGAAIAAFIGLAVTATEAKKSAGTVGDLPMHNPRLP